LLPFCFTSALGFQYFTLEYATVTTCKGLREQSDFLPEMVKFVGRHSDSQGKGVIFYAEKGRLESLENPVEITMGI
jgi:hypothetical protein